jgi:hypothetical protein
VAQRPGTENETLTFFLYRYHFEGRQLHARMTRPVPVNGTGVGFAWYSSGPIALTLLAGNYYQLGVAWPGTVSYTYKTATSGAPTSFGIWHRATTPVFPLPNPYSISGTDAAQYYQRLSFFPYPVAGTVGTGCSVAAVPPRVTIDRLPKIGAQFSIDLADGAANAPAVYLLAFVPPLATPIPLLGCSFWLNPFPGPVLSFPTTLSATGIGGLQLLVPNNPLLANLPLSTQAGVVNGASLDLTNAYQMPVQ